MYSAAARLVGVEISEEFVRLQNGVLEKYGFTDRMQVLPIYTHCFYNLHILLL